MNEQNLRFHAQSFLETIFNELQKTNFILDTHWHIDHLCYRTSTEDSYSLVKSQMSQFSNLLIESEVNGRLISTFKLENPIEFNSWKIDLIEVPAPKKGKLVKDGFEHIEVVCDLTFDELKSRFSHCRFDESGLAKVFNQELEVLFSGFAVKFHQLSLESVVNIEANPQVYSALKNSDILGALKGFSPLVAGTFPLKVNQEKSDLDILVSGPDLKAIKECLIQNFSSFLDFKCDQITVLGESTVLASFKFDGVDFEIFGQHIDSVKQTGYRHFLAEERLLKLGGPAFLNKVLAARARGLKTEPAFGHALGIVGDPYQELLQLQRKSNQELKRLLKFMGFLTI